MSPGGRIVCTASLAGLTAVPDDPVYALTKHAVVGFVRERRGALEPRGIAINAICPGFADTPMVAGTLRERLEGGLPAAVRRGRRGGGLGRAESGATGYAWVVQPGRPPIDFRFPRSQAPARGDETVGLPPQLSA